MTNKEALQWLKEYISNRGNISIFPSLLFKHFEKSFERLEKLEQLHSAYELDIETSKEIISELKTENQRLIEKETVIRPIPPHSPEGMQGKTFICLKCGFNVTYHQYYCDNCGQHLRERDKSKNEVK